MIRAGIIGASGYTGGELIRILNKHPECSISFAHSRSNAHKRIADVHRDLIGETEMQFSAEISMDVDILFLCNGHGESQRFLTENRVAERIRIIDLSQDFRYNNSNERFFVYGLPELNRLQIMNAQNIANPGCFATAIQLAVLPLAVRGILNNEIHISGITGSTGAGQNLLPTTHFSWRDSNISLYKPFTHQHITEITETLKILQTNTLPQIRFIPFRGNFTRGILTAVYTKTDKKQSEVVKLYQDYYRSHPFVFITEGDLDLKQVINTNKSIIRVNKYNDILLIENVIDNLLKGASGQAVQNMNLMFGLEESCGLEFKSIAF